PPLRRGRRSDRRCRDEDARRGRRRGAVVITVDVKVPGGGYPVVVGAGARCELASLVPRGARRLAVVTQDGLPTVELPLPHLVLTIGQGEEHKTLSTVEDLCWRFTRFGLTRTDAVVVVGGGMVTDVGGFAAAVYHRGVAVIHV